MASVADETKGTVIATGRLLGGVDAYWRQCAEVVRSSRRGMVSPPAGIEGILRMVCEVLVRAHALCCHAIVRARWAAGLDADDIDEELLLAHSTDMPEPLWQNPEWRRALVGWNAVLEKRPVESTLLGGVAVLCLGAAFLHVLYPSSGPMLEGDATMFLDDGDAMMEVEAMPQPEVSVLPGDDGAVVSSAADAAAAAAGLHDFASPAHADPESGRGLWGLLEAMGAPPRHRLALSLRNRLGFVSLPSFSSSTMPADPWVTGQGPLYDTSPAFSGADADAESRAWLARHAQIAPEGFVDRAREFSESVGAAVRAAVGAAAVAGVGAWACVRTVRWLGRSATPKLRTRALAELERAADLAMAGLHRLARGTFGEASAAALRHRAWAARSRGSKSARGPASLAGAEAASVDLPALTRPLSTGGASGVAAASRLAVSGPGAPSSLGGRRSTLHSWEVESASLTVDLSDVLRALDASAEGAASLARLMRAMRPLRRRLADSGSQSRLAAMSSATRGHDWLPSQSAAEADDDGDACSEAGEEVDVTLTEDEVDRCACFLLSLVQDAVASSPRPARAAPGGFAGALEDGGAGSAAGTASAGAGEALAPAEGRRRQGRGAGLRRQSDPSGTGSTADARRSLSSCDGDGDLEALLDGLRVTSPRDRSFLRVLEAMQRLELERKHASDETRAPECVLCLDPMLPHQPLVRSSHGACSRYHIFHRDCFSLAWAQDHGCPVCREPVFALRPAAVDTPFVLHAPGTRTAAVKG